MTDMSLPGVALFLALVVVLLWFAFGTQHNIKRGNDLLRWFQGGLVLLGDRTTLRWLGSSAVQLNISEPRPPLGAAEVVIALEPRDLVWLWPLSRRRGRRDMMILRARLERAPLFELEAGDPSGWTGTDRIDRLDTGSWYETRWGDRVMVFHARDADPELVRKHWEDLGSAAGAVWRLSIRREHPHLEAHLPVPDTKTTDPRRIAECFLDLARSVVTKP